MSFKRIFISQKGFSLMEIMIAGSILLVIGLGVMTLMKNMARSTRSGVQSADAQSLVFMLNSVLSNENTCTRNFGSTGAGITLSSTVEHTEDIIGPDGSGGWVPIVDVASNTAYMNNSVTVPSWTYELVNVVGTSPYRVIGKLTIKMKKVGGGEVAVGGDNLARTIIMMNELTGPNGTIVSCYAIGNSGLSAVGATSCTPGTTVTGVVDGVPSCTLLPTTSRACGAGEYVTGFDSAGEPVCTTNSAFAPLTYVTSVFDCPADGAIATSYVDCPANTVVRSCGILVTAAASDAKDSFQCAIESMSNRCIFTRDKSGGCDNGRTAACYCQPYN